MVGERIKAIRKSKGLTQRDAAIKANVSQSLWSDIENGKVAAPHIDTLAKMAGSLEVPVAALLDDKTTTPGLTWFWRSRFALLRPSDLLSMKRDMSDRIAWVMHQLLDALPLAEVASILKLPEAELPKLAVGDVQATPALADILVAGAEVPMSWLMTGEEPLTDDRLRKVMTHRHAAGYLKVIEKAIDNRILPELLDHQLDGLVHARQTESPSGI